MAKNICEYIIAAKKLNVESKSEIIKNRAIFFSPNSSKCSVSRLVKFATLSMLKTLKRTPADMIIDMAVLPETSCQGLFNQIHKKVTILRLVPALKIYFQRFPLIFSLVLRIIKVGKSLLLIFQKGGAKSC